MSRPTRERLAHFRNVTVMGLGLFGGGAGAARYFASLGARVTVTDLASGEKLAASVSSLAGLGIRFVLGEHAFEHFTGADLVVANQAVRPDNRYLQAARDAGVPIVTETGLALGLCRSPWVGITGSSGKSTTAALAAAMLRRHDPDTLLGGNIGGDLLTRMAGLPPHAPAVVELSSFQLTYLDADLAAGRVSPPRVAALTNITPNHLDWHKDMDEYADAKFALARHQRAEDWVIVNADDPGLRDRIGEMPGRVLRCTLNDAGYADSCHCDAGGLVVRLDGRDQARIPLDSFRLLGRHNLYNALEAAAAAHVMCRDAVAVAEGLSAFDGLPHRLEAVGRRDGRLFVNDSKATTPEAAVTALEALAQPKVLIAGGYDKHSPFEALGAAIQRRAVGLVLLGAAASRIRAAVDAAADERPASWGALPVVEAGDDFRRAVTEAFRLAPSGGVVLLSPACASYGMFANYEERGKAFRDIAGGMEGEC